MTRINPYTGEPLPMNEYIPQDLKPIKALEYKPVAMPEGWNEITTVLPNRIAQPNVPQVNADSKVGEKLLGNAAGIANFGLSEYANFQNTASSTKESQMQALGSAASGASLGLAVGGPLGAVVGGVAGGALGLADMKRDQNKRVEQGDREHRDKVGDRIAERKRSHYTSQGEGTGNMEDSFSNRKFYNPYG